MDSENNISDNENTNQEMYKAILIDHLMKNLIINQYRKENLINCSNR